MQIQINDYYDKTYILKVSNRKVSKKLEDIISYIYDTYPHIQSFNLIDYDVCKKYTYISINHVTYVWDLVL